MDGDPGVRVLVTKLSSTPRILADGDLGHSASSSVPASLSFLAARRSWAKRSSVS
jgi:hypothetical protein